MPISILPPTKLTNWTVLSSNDVSLNKHLQIREDEVVTQTGKQLSFYTTKMGPAVMVFPVTKDKKLLLVRQYKHGAGCVIIEGAAGMVDEGETLTHAAIRELEEESGIIYPEEKLISLGKNIPLPTKNTHVLHGFLAFDAEINGNTKFDDHENIETFAVTFPEAVQLIESDEIWAAGTVAFIFKIKLKFPELFN